jgi:hypothetical protein
VRPERTESGMTELEERPEGVESMKEEEAEAVPIVQYRAIGGRINMPVD